MELTRIALILILATSSLFMKPANAQTNPIAGPPNPLYAQVFTADSTAFAALNAYNVNQMMSFFTTDVEFYNDGGGVTTYQRTSLNFANMFKGAPDIRRELVKGSLEVYPLQGYGLLQLVPTGFVTPKRENRRVAASSLPLFGSKRREAGKWLESLVMVIKQADSFSLTPTIDFSNRFFVCAIHQCCLVSFAACQP